jgi:glycosyltransferase involved in cell wall biosynthesis
MSFSYIIPFKYTDDRFETLKRVLENIKDLDCETIIIEQGPKSFLTTKELSYKFKYIFLHNEMPFNKSWSLNIAYREASFDKIVFGDADNLININFIIEGLNALDTFEMVSPHSRLVDLSPEESKLDKNEIFRINIPGRGETDHQKMTLCGAMTMFRKDSLEKIAGWPEEFIGWGAEDDAMSIKVKHFLSWNCFDYNCYHLWHERAIVEQNLYYRNLYIYNNYLKATKESFSEYLDKVKPFIGDKNRKITI